MGWKMDWRKFRAWLRDEFNVTNAYMFIGYMPNYEEMYTQMHDLGYLIVLKPTLEMYAAPEGAPASETVPGAPKPEERVKPAVKGNIDAEMVLYAMKEMASYEKAIIVSGDGDFYCLVEYLDQQKKLMHIMAPNRQYSTLLRPYEKYVIRIDQLRGTLAYRDFKKRRPAKDK